MGGGGGGGGGDKGWREGGRGGTGTKGWREGRREEGDGEEGVERDEGRKRGDDPNNGQLRTQSCTHILLINVR